LREYLQRHPETAILYPVGIDAIRAVHALRDELGSTHQLIGVSSETLELFDDKELANTVARRAGVEVPRSIQATSLDELREAAINLDFPIIIKSGNNAGPVLGRKAYVVNDITQLDAEFAAWPDGHDRLLLQRYVQGRIVACDFVARDGKIVAYYQSAHARTDAADGTGYVVDFRAVRPTPELVDTLQKIVAHTGYSGPGLLQCAVASETGSCFFIELNPRLSAGVAEAVNAGLDLPLIALCSGLGYGMPPVRADSEPGYRVNARTYWLERDVVGLMRRRRELRWTEVARHVWLIGGSLIASEAHINWSWRDPAPSFNILLGYVRRALSPLKARLRRSNWMASAYLRAVRSTRPLPPGTLTDLYARESRDRRYLLEQASRYGRIFKATRWNRIIICVVGLQTCRRMLSECGDHLRSHSVDLTKLFPKGILRNLEGEDHRHYRQALVAAIGVRAGNDASEIDSKTIDRWLREHAMRFSDRASTPRELTRTLDKIATALLIQRYFGVTLATDDFEALMAHFHDLGPDGFVWNVGAPQEQSFHKIRDFLHSRLPESPGSGVRGTHGVMQRCFNADTLDDVMLGNLIYMVEMGRYDLHSLFRWLLKYAAENPEIMTRIAAEDRETRTGEKGTASAFVKETLRLDQSERLTRVVKKDFVFDGYFFPKDAQVRLCLWESHKLEENFADPFEFKPQRFLDHEYGLDVFAPFGLNQHRCPMASPVIQMGADFVGTLADGYRVEPVAGTAANRGPYHWQPGENFSVVLRVQQSAG
jgi:cytochrome P450/predicted ATP-grasp superfamily ATP-dependent carboligase